MKFYLESNGDFLHRREIVLQGIAVMQNVLFISCLFMYCIVAKKLWKLV